MADDPVWREHGLRHAVLAGDEDAWRVWYDESSPQLEAYVYWRCGGMADLAEDVLQEAWLTAVRRIGDFDPRRGRFVTWLYGIAAKCVANQLRRRLHQTRHVQPLVHEPAGPMEASPIEEREHAERLARALAALPPRQEEALRRKYLEGLSVAEIAAESGESVKAVESRLTRARQAFRAVYGSPEDAS